MRKKYMETGGRRTYLRSIAIAFCSLLFAFCAPFVQAADNTIEKMRDETTAYFKPMTGRVLSVENKNITINLGMKDSVKKGMRFQIFREEAPFKHPVTKEPLGKMEVLTGMLEIKEVREDASFGSLIKGTAEPEDRIRISEKNINLLFCQSKNIDWSMADAYYRSLKETGRFHLIDTGIEAGDLNKILREAADTQADVALVLASEPAEAGTVLIQKLYWVSDGMMFSEMKTVSDAAFTKELKFGQEYYRLQVREASLRIELSFDAVMLTEADVDGDGKQETALGTEREVSIYTLGAGLQSAFGGVRIKGSGSETFLRIDAIDLNRNGKDEIILTSMQDNDIISYIYELKGGEFILLKKYSGFLRRLGNGLVAQEYSPATGFQGAVYSILWEGEYKQGPALKLPKGVNIYDFIHLEESPAGPVILAYSEDGFLNVYDGSNTRIWRSADSTGTFLTTFKKKSPSDLIDKGEWSIKDRLLRSYKQVLSVKRIPLLNIMKGAGSKESQIMSLWWNGLSLEDRVLFGNINGAVLDFTITGDKVLVLARPPFGLKPANILKGESPLKTELYIYSLQGM
jgi:hypothetical protein